MPQFTRNHLRLDRGEDSTTSLRPSDFLLSNAGATSHLRWRKVGEHIDAGGIVGRLEGSRQACHLYAPFPLTIVAAGENALVVRAEGPAIDDLLELEAYENHLATIPR